MFEKRMAIVAIDLVMPSILECMEKGLTKRKQLHIVVARRETGTAEDILLERSIGGPPEKFDGPFDQIAHSKTLISLRSGLSSAEVQLLRPDLLLPGDTKYWGSAVRGTIVVGASGVQPFYDEMFSSWIADTCVALVKDWQKEHAAKSDFY